MEKEGKIIVSEVKKMYFTSGSHQPTFEMQDGTIRQPYLRHFWRRWETVWLTDDELKIMQKRIEEEVKEEAKKDKWWKLW